ncbi:TPA: hypothetical protein NKX79_004619 [Vibrio parahaemolyticus]|nr:hypothetical protein [Vibrio parahaemolyticus]HCG9795585.1 hypothetical protein [Vibrio parahaemolyticus]HCH4925134.1 hypothetical protein [Vibrio parahaemolyticus]
MEVINQVFLSMLTAGSVTGFSLWLGKTFISNKIKNSIKVEYDKELAAYKLELDSKLKLELETYKVELNSKSMLELEMLKHNLLIENSKHQILFEELHSKRIGIIADLYRVLVDIERICKKANRPHYVERILSDSIDSDQNKIQIKFSELFHYNRIFFSDSLCKKLEMINIKYGEPLHSYYFNKNGSDNNSDTIEKLCESFGVAYQYISEAKLEIEGDFRIMIGVEK